MSEARKGRRIARTAAYAGGAALLTALLWQTGVLALVWAGVVAGGRFVSSRYGLDLTAAVVGFAIAEAVYIGTIGLMLAEAGRAHAWRDIREFHIRDLRLGTPRMLLWWWLNRASWFVFWLAVLIATWGRVPWWASAAAITDIVVNLFWGVVVTVGLRMPWWGSRHQES